MTDQAILICINLSDSEMETLDAIERIQEGESRMRELIEEKNLGELDGHEYGPGEYTIYIYGKDADAMFKELFPFLASWDCIQGGYAIKRYGPPGAKMDKITFDMLKHS